MKKTDRFSAGSRWLHGIVAVIVIAMLSGSFFLEDLPDPIKGTSIMLHKSFGLTVLWLMLLRMVWIFHSGRPDLPESTPCWERMLSRFVQYSFYGLLIAMPLCGWAMSMAAGHVPSYFSIVSLPLPAIPQSKALSEFLFQMHQMIAWILIMFIVVHVLGALKHYFINKDRVLQRMFSSRG